MNPFQVVHDFERALSDYTGAPYVVTVSSCTAALRLALRWWYLGHGEREWNVTVPTRTYPSVPMAVVWAGLRPLFAEMEWSGMYVLYPTQVRDAAKRLTGHMYCVGQFQCVSFHPQKPLGLSNGGGAILHDNAEADVWFRRMRFDGRTEGIPTKDDEYTMIGEHCYMMPPTAAEGLQRLSIYAREYDHANQPSELELYPDLSKWAVFREA